MLESMRWNVASDARHVDNIGPSDARRVDNDVASDARLLDDVVAEVAADEIAALMPSTGLLVVVRCILLDLATVAH